MNCEKCKHYHEIKDPNAIGSRIGQCWRFPPVPFPVNAGGGAMAIAAMRPTVRQDESCGEYATLPEKFTVSGRIPS